MVEKWYFFFNSIILSSAISWHSVSSWAILCLFVCLSVYLSVSFNLSIFLLAEIHGFLFWARSYNLLLTLLFWRSTCLRFGHYSSFILTSISFSMPLSFFERFIPVRKHISGSFTLPRSENQPFLQAPQIPVVEDGVHKSRPGHLVCSLLLGILASRILQPTDLQVIYMYVLS